MAELPYFKTKQRFRKLKLSISRLKGSDELSLPNSSYVSKKERVAKEVKRSEIERDTHDKG